MDDAKTPAHETLNEHASVAETVDFHVKTERRLVNLETVSQNTAVAVAAIQSDLRKLSDIFVNSQRTNWPAILTLGAIVITITAMMASLSYFTLSSHIAPLAQRLETVEHTAEANRERDETRGWTRDDHYAAMGTVHALLDATNARLDGLKERLDKQDGAITTVAQRLQEHVSNGHPHTVMALLERVERRQQLEEDESE